MEQTTKASLGWGLVGALTFLVLVQGYHLAGGSFVGVSVMGGVAVVVFLVVAATAQLLGPRLARRNERA